MLPFRNLAFYRFTPLKDLPALRTALKSVCAGLQLRGTILIASEGINGMASGSPDSIRGLREYLLTHFKMNEGDFKETETSEHSFTRLLVKIKKEIISAGDSTISPLQKTGARLNAKELKRWLDEGRPMTLVDTRNDYEIEVGTFSGAKDLALKTFRQFSEQAKHLKTLAADQPIVTFCTGGIRCEKASAILLDLGLKEVYQLDGGILRYFEETGGAHFEGNCFVFDWRLAVDKNLKPAPRSKNSKQIFGRHKS